MRLPPTELLTVGSHSTCEIIEGVPPTRVVVSSVFAPSHEIRSTLRPGREDELSPMGDLAPTIIVWEMGNEDDEDRSGYC